MWGFVCLRRATAKCEGNETEVNRLESENSRTAERKWFGETVFEFGLINVLAARANIVVHPLTTELAGRVTGFILIGSSRNLGQEGRN